MRLDGHKIRYETAGPRHGTAVVLIHGWACDSSFWRLQVPELARRFRVLAVDLPGHGKSDKPPLDYDGPLFAKAVRAAMDAEKINRAVLVGHSMGTEIAGRLLYEAPDRVIALVSVDGVVMRTSPAGTKEWAASMRGPSGVEVRRKFIQEMFTPATPPDLRHEIAARMLATPPHVAASANGALSPPGFSRSCDDTGSGHQHKPEQRTQAQDPRGSVYRSRICRDGPGRPFPAHGETGGGERGADGVY